MVNPVGAPLSKGLPFSIFWDGRTNMYIHSSPTKYNISLYECAYNDNKWVLLGLVHSSPFETPLFRSRRLRCKCGWWQMWIDCSCAPFVLWRVLQRDHGHQADICIHLFLKPTARAWKAQIPNCRKVTLPQVRFKKINYLFNGNVQIVHHPPSFSGALRRALELFPWSIYSTVENVALLKQ